MSIWKNGGIIFGSALATAGIVIGALWLIFPHEYSSTMRVLVVQKYTLTDSYTAAKSAEKISKGLASVIHTSTFIDKIAQNKTVNISEILVLSEKDKRDTWEKTVGADKIGDTSMLEITAYDEDPKKAESLVKAVANVLVTEGDAYHGAGDTVDLRVVDSPLTSAFPARPNLMLYGPAAFVLGALAGVLFVFFRPITRAPEFKMPDAMPQAIPPQQPVQPQPQPRQTVVPMPNQDRPSMSMLPPDMQQLHDQNRPKQQ